MRFISLLMGSAETRRQSLTSVTPLVVHTVGPLAFGKLRQCDVTRSVTWCNVILEGRPTLATSFCPPDTGAAKVTCRPIKHNLIVYQTPHCSELLRTFSLS